MPGPETGESRQATRVPDVVSRESTRISCSTSKSETLPPVWISTEEVELAALPSASPNCSLSIFPCHLQVTKWVVSFFHEPYSVANTAARLDDEPRVACAHLHALSGNNRRSMPDQYCVRTSLRTAHHDRRSRSKKTHRVGRSRRLGRGEQIAITLKKRTMLSLVVLQRCETSVGATLSEAPILATPPSNEQPTCAASRPRLCYVQHRADL